MVIMATILLLERNAREHDWTAVSLHFSGCSSLYRISIMGVFSCYYHLFNQNFTGRHDSVTVASVLSHLVVRTWRFWKIKEKKNRKRK